MCPFDPTKSASYLKQKIQEQSRSDVAPLERLTILANRELGLALTKREVRLFIKAYWREISVLAHKVHEID